MRHYLPMFARHAIVGGFLGFITTFLIDSYLDSESKLLVLLLFIGLSVIAGSMLELYFPAAQGKKSVADEDIVE